MIHKISWGVYIESMIAMLVIYYAIVVLLFFKGSIRQLGKAKLELAMPGGINDRDSKGADNALLQSLSDEADAFFAAAADENFDKQQVVHALTILLEKYPLDKTTISGKSAVVILADSCQRHCSIHLSEEDISALMD